MPLIIDADVIIRGERGLFDLPSWLEQQAEHPPQIAAVTIGELWHGLYRATAKHRDRRETYLSMIVDVLSVLPYTRTIAVEHARLWAELESSGNMIGPYDLIVAATALQHGSSVVTFNHRHFSKVRGLILVQPA